MTDQTIAKRKVVERPVVSDLDGTQQGGLAFTVSVLGGLVAAAVLAPGSLTSFWVWFAILMMSVAVASGTQKLFSRTVPEKTE